MTSCDHRRYIHKVDVLEVRKKHSHSHTSPHCLESILCIRAARSGLSLWGGSSACELDIIDEELMEGTVIEMIPDPECSSRVARVLCYPVDAFEDSNRGHGTLHVRRHG